VVFGPAGCWPRCRWRGVPWYVARDAESAVLRQDVQRPVRSAAAVRDEDLLRRGERYLVFAPAADRPIGSDGRGLVSEVEQAGIGVLSVAAHGQHAEFWRLSVALDGSSRTYRGVRDVELEELGGLATSRGSSLKRKFAQIDHRQGGWPHAYAGLNSEARDRRIAYKQPFLATAQEYAKQESSSSRQRQPNLRRMSLSDLEEILRRQT
jgi:hypothetical protein